MGIYPNDAHSYHKEACSTVFIAALFVTDRIWKQPRCSSAEEWVKKIWYIWTMEYYSAVKNNDIMKFEVKQIDLKKSHRE